MHAQTRPPAASTWHLVVEYGTAVLQQPFQQLAQEGKPEEPRLLPAACWCCLLPGAGELRYNRLSSPETGYNPTSSLPPGAPPAPFTAGFPLAVEGPQLEGYSLLPGRTLYTHGQYNCTGTIRRVDLSGI